MTRHHVRRGLTLLELLLALAVTVLTGAAASAITLAVSRGLSGITAGRSATQRAHLIQSRLRAVTDPASCLLASDVEKGLAVWSQDSNADGRVNVNELRVVWIDSAESTLNLEFVKFPDDWAPEILIANNIVVASIEDPFVAMETQRALGHTVTERIASRFNVGSVQLSNPTAPTSARLRLAGELIDDQGEPVGAIVCLGFPNHQQPQ